MDTAETIQGIDEAGLTRLVHLFYERVRDDAAPGLHPPVDITLEPHHDLGLVEHPRRFHPLQRLTEIELRVVLGHGMDVVQGRIAVDDLHWLTNLRAEPFTADSLRVSATNGIVLVLDVPRIADPPRTFDQMKLTAKRLAHNLGGELVDDNARALDDAALASIRKQVEAAAQALRESGIEPGSPRALALFGA